MMVDNISDDSHQDFSSIIPCSGFVLSKDVCVMRWVMGYLLLNSIVKGVLVRVPYNGQVLPMVAGSISQQRFPAAKK
jgi:hypothetical protein